MTGGLFLPIDVVTGHSIDFDRAADFLELAAFFSPSEISFTSDLANAASIGAAEDHADVQDEMENGEEEIVSGTVNRIDSRQRALGCAYPFDIDNRGDVLSCVIVEDSLAHAAYVLSLLLSNLRSLSAILSGFRYYPDEDEVRLMREYFQYFSTAALAGEVRGDAWSFGSPRPDRSPFIGKLTAIWQELRDGRVEAQSGAPDQPQDDQVDVFAARLHQDRLPGFLLAVAQVATGQNAAQKSLKGHLDAFKSRWFATQPVTQFIGYMIVPFARSEGKFLDDVRTMGNVLHRLRVPRRVAEAGELVAGGGTVEGYDRLADAAQWLKQYRMRAAGI